LCLKPTAGRACKGASEPAHKFPTLRSQKTAARMTKHKSGGHTASKKKPGECLVWREKQKTKQKKKIGGSIKESSICQFCSSFFLLFFYIFFFIF
jgi:hypothetical protein